MTDNPTGQDVTELVFGILARRVFDETLLGYIHEASKEIAGAISQASPPPQIEPRSCSYCGSYYGQHIEGCPHDILPPQDEVERVALALAKAHDAIQNPRKNYAVTSYRAGASVDYWNAQARAALTASRKS